MKRTVTCFLFLASCFVASVLHAQPFGKEYVLGASTIWQVVKPTSDGNLITIGDYTSTDVSPNIIVITKLRGDGTIIWSKTYGGDVQQNGLNVTETSDGSFVIVGVEFTYNINTSEFSSTGCVIKLSGDGKLLWSHYLQYGNQDYLVLDHVIATSDGGVIVGGSFNQFTSGSVGSYGYIANIDMAGNLRWAKQFDTKGYRRWIAEMFYAKQAVTIVSESAIGNGNNAGDAANITLMSEADGSVIAAQQFRLNGGGIHFIQAACTTPDDGIVVSGTAGEGVGSFDIWTFKVNNKLNLQWSTLIKQGADDRPNKLYSDTAGNVMIGGVSSNSDNVFNPYLLWLNSNGEMTNNQLLAQPTRGVFGINSLGSTMYALVNREFGADGSPYAALYAFGSEGMCASASQAGTWQSAPDVITDNRKTSATDVITLVSDMNYTVADVLFSTNSLCSVLPLQLLSFTGASENNGIVLQWQTANEINTNSFDVERSNDGGITYTKTGAVIAGGQRNNSYTFTDHSSSDNNLLYRLKTIDRDGGFTYSNSIAIAGSMKAVVLFPNPAKDQVTVRIVLPYSLRLQVFITTVTGQTVWQQSLLYSKGMTDKTIGITHLPAGIYFITVTGGSNKQTLRFEKQP